MAKPVNKAKEITDARISFVSLVDKAANKRPFLIVKNEDGKAAFTTYGRIIKSDDNRHFVTGIVYEPMTEDAHGNYMTADEIAKAAFWFAKNGNKVDLQHNFVSEEGTAVVESWIAKSDCDIGGETVKEGTWLMTIEINDDSLWQSIQNGEITGLSMGGLGVYAQEDTDLSSASVTKSQGRVEKGAVTDNFKQSNTSSSFWNAFDALRSALYSYNSYTGAYTYQTDEDAIKAALEEFGTIITNLLTDASSEKPLTKSLFECKPTPELGRIEKAGRSLSAKNREALQGLYDSLGTFLASVDANPDKDKPGGDTGTAEDDQQADKGKDKKQAADDNKKAAAGNDSAASDNKTDDPDNKTSGDDTSIETTKTTKEGKTMTKSEAEKLVQEAVAKALGQQQTEQQAKAAAPRSHKGRNDRNDSRRRGRRSDPYAAAGGTNVNFVEIVSDGRIRVRTYERGVEAETLACGTGATASALAAAVRSGSDCRNYRVDVEGGVLFVSFERTGDERFTNVTLTGPAQKVFEGCLAEKF